MPWYPYTKLSAWEQFRMDLLLYFCKPPPVPLTAGQTEGDRAESHPGDKRIKIVCISDTHNSRPPIPDGDILVHTGDLTNDGTFDEMQAQLNWLGTMPHKYKLVVAGNHDKVLDPKFVMKNKRFDAGGKLEDLEWHDIKYLENESVTVDLPHLGRSLKIYGCPQTPACGTWAFQHFRKDDVWKDTIPDDTDVLLCHGPPKGHLDDGDKGCPHLLREVRRARPQLVVFGHIHEARGTEIFDHEDWDTYARDQINMCNLPPGILTILAIIIGLLFNRALQRLGLRGDRVTDMVKGRTSKLVNAASMGRFGLRENEEDGAGTVVYM